MSSLGQNVYLDRDMACKRAQAISRSAWHHGAMIRAHLPTPDAAALSAFLTTHTRAGETLIQVAGLAGVLTYHGRAASTAEVGACLVMIKRDGSLQVHAPTGIKPMNWQPRTDELSTRVEVVLCPARVPPQST